MYQNLYLYFNVDMVCVFFVNDYTKLWIDYKNEINIRLKKKLQTTEQKYNN